MNVDGLFSAQVGRNLVEEHSFKTSYISLFEVQLYRVKGLLDNGPPWPNANRTPLGAVLRAPLVWITASAIAPHLMWFSTFWYFVTILTLVYSGLRLLYDHRIGFLSAFFFAASTLSIFVAMQGKEVSLDGALFLVTVVAVTRVLQEPLVTSRAAAFLGCLVGIQILGRYSIGLTLFPAVSLILIVHGWRKSQFRPTRYLVTYVLCALILCFPLLAFNHQNFGSPIFSTNAYFQLPAFGRYASYLNPWWKLSYVFPVSDLQFHFIHLGEIVERWRFFFNKQWQYFLMVGLPELGFTPWWSWLAGYGAICAVRGRPPLRTFAAAGGVLSVIVALPHLFVVPIFAGIPEYTWFLYPTMALFAGIGGIHLYDRLNAKLTSASLSIKNEFVELGIVSLAISGTVFALLQSVGSFTAARQMSEMKTVLAATGIAIFLLGTAAGKRIPSTRLLAIILIIIAVAQPLFVFRGPMRTEAVKLAPDWLTDPNKLTAISEFVRPHGIILSLQPWNVTWQAKRASLPLPEYPDEISSLIADYGLGEKIEAVYLWGITDRALADIGPALGLNAYRRAWLARTPLQGFRIVDLPRLKSSGVLMTRDRTVLATQLMRTREIVVGEPGYVGHFVSGFSADEWIDGRLGLWAAVPRESAQVGYWEQRTVWFQSQGINQPVKEMSGATITFNTDRPARTDLSLKVWCADDQQVIQVVLNANLLYADQPGILVASIPIPRSGQWVDISFRAESQFVRRGLNRIDLIFSKLSPAKVRGAIEYRYCAVNRVLLRENPFGFRNRSPRAERRLGAAAGFRSQSI